MTVKTVDCPCGSAKRHAECCRPFHEGAEPPTAEGLMRSRFSAYALGVVDYLWRTLAASHPDRAKGAEAFTAQVRQARQRLKYVRLRVLDSAEDASGNGSTARVLFHAEIYEAGKERSFFELSDFTRETSGWRYVGGTGEECRAGDARLDSLNIASFG